MHDDDDGVAKHGGHTPNNRLTDMQPVYFFGIGHPCYDQLTPVQKKVSADQYHVTISRSQVNSSSRSSFFEVDR